MVWPHDFPRDAYLIVVPSLPSWQAHRQPQRHRARRIDQQSIHPHGRDFIIHAGCQGSNGAHPGLWGEFQQGRTPLSINSIPGKIFAVQVVSAERSKGCNKKDIPRSILLKGNRNGNTILVKRRQARVVKQTREPEDTQAFRKSTRPKRDKHIFFMGKNLFWGPSVHLLNPNRLGQ